MNDFLLNEDVNLMLKFRDGDDSAFEALLEKYHHSIINFVYRAIPDKQEAEDLAQEVFLRVYRSRQNYEPKAKFSTWIYKIAKNLLLNEIRRRKTHKQTSLEEITFKEGKEQKQFPDNKPSIPIELDRQNLIDTVRKAIDALPPNQKIAVILRRYEELSYEDIAKIIGCSVSAVKSLLNRAKLNLKEKLYPYVQK